MKYTSFKAEVNMRMIKSNKMRFTLSLIAAYGLKALYLLNYDTIEKDIWIMHILSFLLVYCGILGFIYKIDVFKNPPRNAILSYTRSYKNADDFTSFMGNLGNALAVIIGTLLFLVV